MSSIKLNPVDFRPLKPRRPLPKKKLPGGIALQREPAPGLEAVLGVQWSPHFKEALKRAVAARRNHRGTREEREIKAEQHIFEALREFAFTNGQRVSFKRVIEVVACVPPIFGILENTLEEYIPGAGFFPVLDRFLKHAGITRKVDYLRNVYEVDQAYMKYSGREPVGRALRRLARTLLQQIRLPNPQAKRAKPGSRKPSLGSTSELRRALQSALHARESLRRYVDGNEHLPTRLFYAGGALTERLNEFCERIARYEARQYLARLRRRRKQARA